MIDKIKKIAEDIEGLPKSSDPYNPYAREDTNEVEPLEQGPDTDEIEPTEDIDQEFGTEPEITDNIDPLSDEEINEQPALPTWEQINSKNKKQVMFRRSDGFTLRAQKFDSVPGKWIAQLFSKDKILDKGMLFIPKNVDPVLYLQKMSDYMLDKETERFNTQTSVTKPTQEMEKEPISAGSAEDIGLDNENINLE